MYWRYAESELKKAYRRGKEDIDNVLLFLKSAFPNAELLYSKVLPRCWWGDNSRKLARWLDHYIVGILRKSHKIREIWARDCFSSHYHFHENVDFGMLKCDLTHLNYNGNKALIKATMSAVLNKWKWAK